MAAGRFSGFIWNVASPLLYVLGFVIAFVGFYAVPSLFYLIAHRLRLEEHVPTLASNSVFSPEYIAISVVDILVVGGLVIGLMTRLVAQLERLRSPNVLDHLRHCLLLYALVAYSAYILIDGYEQNIGNPYPTSDDLSVAYLWVLLGFLISGYGVTVNALILFRKWRRFAHTAERSPA